MSGWSSPGLARVWDRQAERRWRRAAREASKLDADALKTMISQARALRRRLDRVLNVAETRVSQFDSDAPIEVPLHSDWVYRPQPWSAPLSPGSAVVGDSGTRLGAETAVFHDCPLGEITVRQEPSSTPANGARYRLSIDVLGFEGRFLSVAVDLPCEAAAGLKKRHLVRADLTAEAERPLDLFARLNVVHGPNNEQLVHRIEVTEGTWTPEFDLSSSNLNEGRVERMWLDLIFDAPQMNRIVVHDLTLSRRPRAEL